jgi:hypothetical protein
MNAGKGTRRPKRAQRPATALAQHVNVERDRLFKAMSIIACCRLACASLLDQGGNLELMADALQAAYDLVDATAGGLEVIGNGAVRRRRIGGK